MLNSLLTETQIQTLHAAADRIVPADDYPGGWDLGVGDFLARLWVQEPEFLPRYRAGLDALDREAQRASGVAFAALSADAQDALLARAEAGAASPEWPDAAAFFGLLVQQVLEGCYADPGSGGNRGGAAWDMIGFRVTG